ncbi:hypothetical protein ASF98_14430 [Arthrobacter sp. Leaf337]|uniref:hypothetical protein n=1 Tax=Arthrobacter sp. Leaf337 TaxID=1736342 RepID=UPI0006F90965|nr:hypothetical protein [Arthrobacter sp. Leaf337]KQR62775.1 hypothetical protein ASF98_14430 [Arthrobacter sp. Leaf337]
MPFFGDIAYGDPGLPRNRTQAQAQARTRAAAVLLMLAAAATAVSGCGSAGASEPGSTSAPGPQSTSTPSSPSYPSSPLSTYVSHGSGSDSARLKGTLVLDSGCLYVEAPNGTDWIPAFPVDEVEWEDGKLLYQGSSYGDGDEILLGGSAGTSLKGVAKPDSCRDTDVWQVGQTD